MYFLSIYLFLPAINALVTTQIHRTTIFRSYSSCAFIGNISSWSSDVSIQSCIWECVHEYNCQTAVYFKDEKVCSMFSELCEKGSVESPGNVWASVICYRKNHEPIITCSSTATTNKRNEERTSDSSMITTNEQTSTSITSTIITASASATTAATSFTTLTTENSYACGNMTILISYDLGGSDIINANLNSYDLCCAWCQSYNGCVSYTWGLPIGGVWLASFCFLKNAIPSASPDSRLVSAHY